MQGRFKRDGNAAADSEPRGGSDRGQSTQHARNTGPGKGRDKERAGGSPTAPTSPDGAAEKADETAAKPAPATGPGSRIALRNWRISTRLVALLTLPVVAATSLGAMRINSSMDEIEQLDNMKLLTEMTKHATRLATALQNERDQSAGPLTHGGKATDYDVRSHRENTDRARKVFLEGTRDLESADEQALDGVRSNVRQITSQLYTLGDIRKEAYQDDQSVSQTIDAYSQLIEQLLDLSTDMAQATSNPDMIQRTRALAAFSSAKEYASIQRAVIAAALPANDRTYGELSETDRRYGSNAFKNEEGSLAILGGVYDGNAETLLKPLGNNATITEANAYAKRVLTEPNGMRMLDKRSYRDWLDDASAELDQMQRIETTLLTEMEQKARELRNEAERDAYINGALILLVLGVSLVGAFVVSRSMIRSLRRLQDTATKVAQERLPELVQQLSESDPQDVDTSVESVGVHSRDEIGKVAAAFDDVHREAVRLAADQALLRGNVNAMFTNLSRRSQGLIQRQLSLISELESREADPDQLSSLFKLDHLATRMRRNGENLLVLAGEEPGRRWTRPVPLVDVLRAAASEVEQYERIELASVPATDVAGRVVNDLVHLLAELLENATSFSSPQTKVKVTGHALPDGRVLIEIHDTGIGLSPEDLSAINERLAQPPTVDVSVSRRMGLFVVGRLSQRHGIRIQLRPSDSGGTTALVMLPVDIAQGGKKVPPKKGPAGVPPGGPGGRRPGPGGPGGAGGQLGAGQGRGQVGSSSPRAALPGREPGAAMRGDAPQQGGSTNLFGAAPAPGGRGPSRPGQGSGQNGPGGLFGGGPGSGADRGARQGGPGPSPFRAPSGGDQRPQIPVQRQDDTGADSLGAVPPNGPGVRADGRRRPQLPPRPGGGQLPPSGPRAELRRRRAASSRGRAGRPSTRRRTTRRAATTNRTPPRSSRPSPSSRARAPRGSSPRCASRGRVARTRTVPLPRASSRFRGTSRVTAVARLRTTSCRAPTPPRGSRRSPRSSRARRAATRTAATRASRVAIRARSSRAATTCSVRAAGSPAGPDCRRSRAVGRTSCPVGPRPRRRRDPLYDTLETNWFRGQGGEPQAEPDPQQAAQAPEPLRPRTPERPVPQRRPAAPAASSWRPSPNDELVKQAERVRQPSAGGVTTSGLPRRVPKANLVPGTAEQQQHPTGPQVSRAPDDVRGRLTNLRRGIQQGRYQSGQGGAPQGDGSRTGGYPGPSHQQER
ncbi:nitrate- and nitrite sensing domain-containing protein [Streptomyces sp. S399]|uniref:nitrate- and nitrite sensing domain-containing protein n=1 Tax=Streptomyces sp. S399 TaxID=3096009 RepID=UPI002A841472|nr:nitrate- and nitrite sensing domain-containing protein [Streptomyces sp. S399]WPR53475.1 nitrate- and nitrite sensing domain-containing protein [Streptomyces sp. S399]